MNFGQLTQQIKLTHETLQSYAVKAINVGLTLRNWLIGHFIVEYEQSGEDRANYGEHLLEKISTALAQNGLKNVSAAELSRFRQFYKIYPQILGTLSQKSLQLPEQILGTTGTLDNQLFVSRYLLELPRKEELERIIETEIIKNIEG